MICNNEVSYFTGDMPNYTERLVKCGTTDPYGERCICDKCRSNPAIMKSIRDHQKSVDADNQWLRSANWGEM